MEISIVTLFFCLLGPLLMMCVAFRGQGRINMIFLLVGMIICIICGQLNQLSIKYVDASAFLNSVTLGPVVEELLKALAVLYAVFVLKLQRQGALECAVAVGVGFALLESTYFMVNYPAEVTFARVLIRGFCTGLMHGVCTLSVAYTLVLARVRGNRYVASVVGALVAAILFHAAFNWLVQSDFFVVAYVLPLLTLIPFLIVMNGKPKKA
ncbi:MAG: PrsW family glutamic-type intramembrane protease [Coriobacteriia bacterium]|nr:PrsW family glutamic-type intramembrane protease [Coriobacteriia bacterium]